MEQISLSEADTTAESNQTNPQSEKEYLILPEVLVEQLRPLINGSSARAAAEFPGFHEDFISEGVVAVLTAAHRFQQSKGQAEHFAARCIRGRLLNSRRSLRHLYHEMTVGAFHSSDDVELRRIWEDAEYQQTQVFEEVRRLENAVDGAKIWEIAPTILTAKELQVVRLVYFEDATATGAAAQMRISVPRVSQLRASALKKLQKHLRIYLG